MISAFQHADKVLPYDDEASLRTQMTTVNPEGNKSLPKARFDCPIKPASQDVSMGEYGLNHMGSSSVDVRFDQPDDFQCHVDNTLICDPSSSMHLQYLGGSSCSDLHCAVDRFLFSCSAIGKAQRRWKIVSSVVKWLLLMLEIRKADVSSSDQKLDKITRL